MNSDISSSIMSTFSNEGPTIILPSYRRSQSVTAVANLQKELHESVIEGVDEQGVLERCSSLPHLKWKGPVEVLTGPRNDGDNISITSAARSEDRVHELETDLVDARDTIHNLQDTVSDLQANMSSLSSQLNGERDKNISLQEELQVSRKLCVELNASRSSLQNENEDYTLIHPSRKSVKEVGLQVAIDRNEDESDGKYSLAFSSVPTSHVNGYTSTEQGLSSQLGRREAVFNHNLEEEELHVLQQQCREKEFQIQKLTEKLSKYYHRNAELEAEQMSSLENLESMERKLSCRDQQVSHMKEVILHQQEDIALLEKIKEDLHSKCLDLEQSEAELEELVESLTEDMTGLTRDKRKLNRHIKDLNTSLESKQVEISDKLGQLEAKSNLLEVIKQIAYNSPSKKQRTTTPRSATTTPRNTPAAPERLQEDTTSSQEEDEQRDRKKTSRRKHHAQQKDKRSSDEQRDRKKTSTRKHHAQQKDKRSSSDNGHEESSVDHKLTKVEKNAMRGQSSDKLKQRKRHASRSLNYNACANPGDPVSNCYSNDNYHGDDGYHGDSDVDVQPVNGFFNDSYISSTEDNRETDSQSSLTSANLLEQNIYEIDNEEKAWSLQQQVDKEDAVLEENKLNFHGNQSSPKKGEQSVEDLIAEVLSELSGQDKCEADMQQLPAESESKMEAEGLLLRKHELESYAMKARDRSWQYVYVVQRGPKLWFYESKEHHIQGIPCDGEDPLDLIDAMVHASSDYTKRKHVFRVGLANGQCFLFQARDDREMLFWVCSMDSATRRSQGVGGTDTFNGAMPGIGAVPPPMVGSPSKTDRLRNMIKGSISALTKTK